MTFSDDRVDHQDNTRLTGGSRATAAEFSPGQIIGDNYQVLAWIGAGGMGNVYRVRHTIMQAEYALKTLSGDRITETAWRRFQNEAKAISRLSHANIVAIYNLGLHQQRLPYYVMDLLKGQPLLDVIRKQGRLSVEEALPVFIEVCAGLAYAHKKGIVHRDVKPGNIFLLEEAVGGSKIKVVDFGIAKLTGLAGETLQHLTNNGEICGSPYYMSPEQCDGGKVDARSDVYSLGCSLFEALTGSPPYRGRNAMETLLMHQSALVPDLASAAPDVAFKPELERAIKTMLAKAPMDRYQNMEALADDLKSIARGKRKTAGEKRQSSPSSVSRRPVAHTSQLQEPIDDTKQKIPFKPLLLGALGLLTIAVATIYCLHTPKPVKTVVKKISTEPFAFEKRSADGKTRIVFSFPNDESLGEIFVDSPERSPGTAIIKCQGAQSVESGHKLYFFPSEVCFYHPEYFYQFRPIVLHSITIPSIQTSPDQHLEKALLQIKELRQLKRLDLVTCNGMTDQALTLIDACPDIEDLALNADYVSVAALVKSKSISRLKSLTFTHQYFPGAKSSVFDVVHEFHELHEELEGHEHGHGHGHGRRHHGPGEHDGEGHHSQADRSVTPLLQALKEINKIEVLELPNVPLAQPDVVLIGQIKSLQAIDLTNSFILSNAISLLTDLPNLYLFHADNCLIDASAIPAFQKMAKHSLKFIYMQSASMAPATVDLYRKSLPGVSVNQ